MIQREYKFIKDNFQVIDGTKLLNKNILLQTFNEFCSNNFTSEQEKHTFNKKALATALCFGKSEKKLVWNIRIYETLGLDQAKLLKNEDITENDVELYNQKLNMYGLSLDEHLTKKDLSELMQEDPDYLRKKEFMK